MKKYLLLILMMLFSVASFSQSSSFYTLDFEDTAALHHLRIDSVSNLNDIWQVGAPQKPIFTNAYYNPNVIVTDTINPYPINDTSSFTIVNVAGDGFTYPHTASYDLSSFVFSFFALVFCHKNFLSFVFCLDLDSKFINYSILILKENSAFLTFKHKFVSHVFS